MFSRAKKGMALAVLALAVSLPFRNAPAQVAAGGPDTVITVPRPVENDTLAKVDSLAPAQKKGALQRQREGGWTTILGLTFLVIGSAVLLFYWRSNS